MRRAVSLLALVWGALSGGCAEVLGLGDYGFAGASPGGAGAGAAAGGGAGGGGGGAGGQGAQGGGAQGGGGAGGALDCGAASKPQAVLEGDVASDTTLGCEHDWLLTTEVHVLSGAKLHIAAGTRVLGRDLGWLVVDEGGSLIAEGTESEPIVFASAETTPAPGDWGGVLLLGQALGNGDSECLGGTLTLAGDDEDSSGSLRFVRIEHAGRPQVGCPFPGGLGLVGVGRGTTLDHVQVRSSADDGFYIAGGAAQGRYLVSIDNADDAFDLEAGYHGKLQFVIGRLATQNDTNAPDGLEVDGPGAVGPFELRNVTLCGQPQVFSKQFGLVHRELAEGAYRRLVLTGFGAGVDVRDSAAGFSLMHSVLWSPAFGAHVGEDESVDDDDEGFDEETLVTTVSNGNVVVDPTLACVGGGVFTPSADVGDPGALPADPEGFFVDAPYVGAHAPGESWLTGAWVVF